MFIFCHCNTDEQHLTVLKWASASDEQKQQILKLLRHWQPIGARLQEAQDSDSAEVDLYLTVDPVICRDDSGALQFRVHVCTADTTSAYGGLCYNIARRQFEVNEEWSPAD